NANRVSSHRPPRNIERIEDTNMDLGINGKVALVTGGSKGIGRAISLELAAAGVKVAVVARERAAIDSTTAAITEQGGIAIGISADLSKLESYDAIVAE